MGIKFQNIQNDAGRMQGDGSDKASTVSRRS